MALYEFSSVVKHTISKQANDDCCHPRLSLQILDTYNWSAVVHVINSLMYFWVWLPSGFRWYHPVMYPEYLNMIGT
jgi:hypothetical protein